MTPSEREAFARGFFGQEYAAEVRLLAREGLLDDEDVEACSGRRIGTCTAGVRSRRGSLGALLAGTAGTPMGARSTVGGSYSARTICTARYVG